VQRPHRGLNFLVAIELKVGRFEPEYLGKLNSDSHRHLPKAVKRII